jgi:putative oxidoreductase
MNKIKALMAKLENHDIGLVLLRLSVGIPFIVAGFSKVTNMSMTISGFSDAGLAPIIAILVSVIELVGGISLIVGIFTRYSSILLSIIMLYAVIFVHGPAGYRLMNGGYEYPLVLLFASLAILALGVGKYSLSKYYSNWKISRQATLNFPK